MMNTKHATRNSHAATRANNSISWKNLLITLVCVTVVAAGFFFAALQHFKTMEMGIKNSALRRQVDELESEQRRLILAREVALSPVQLSRTARRLGFTERSVDAEAMPMTIAASSGARNAAPAVKEVAIKLEGSEKPTAGKIEKTISARPSSKGSATEALRPRVAAPQILASSGEARPRRVAAAADTGDVVSARFSGLD